MKLNYRLMLALTIVLSSFQSFSQVEIIEKVFGSKPLNFRSEIEIIDTITTFRAMSDGYESTFALDNTMFGAEDFKFILIYRHKTLNKCGLIVYGEKKFHATEPVADSIYFVKANEYLYTEYTDEDGNYISSYKAGKLNFIFVQKDEGDEFWEVVYTDQNYTSKNVGKLERAILKAVSFSENTVEEYSSVVTAVFADLKTNKIINSSVLNANLVALEVYAYHYDYYGYEYEAGYVEEPYSDGGISPTTFETRLNYSPVEILYMTSGDTISQLLNYSYVEASEKSAKVKVVPESFSGAWKSIETVNDYSQYIIIEEDDVLTDVGLYAFVTDAYDNLFEVSTLSWNEVLQRLSLDVENQKKLETMWQGSKSEISFISSTSWLIINRYKDFILQNNDNLIHIYFEADIENKLSVGMQTYLPQKIYSDLVTVHYDDLNYLTVYENIKGETLDMYAAGADVYYYSATLAVSEKNIDKSGNLILTNESMGSITLKNYTAGNYYVGQVKVSWVGEEKFGEGVKVIGMKTMPYKILDEANNVLADDVTSLLIENVAGFNLYQIYDSKFKCGILGPDGTWLVKKQYDAVSIVGTNYSYDYYYSSRSFPIYFLVYENDKCGLIDTKANWLAPMGFDYIETCQEGIITVKNNKVGIYSYDGKKILDNEYLIQGYYGLSTDCYSLDMYHKGPKVFSKNGLSGVLDKEFNPIIPFEYTSLFLTSDMKNFIAVNQDGKSGIIDINNKIIVPFEFDFITPFDFVPNRYVVGKDQKQGVIDSEGNILIPIEHYAVQTSSDWYSNVVLIYDENYLTNAIDTTGKSIIQSGCGYIYYYPAYDLFYCGTDINFNFYNRAGNLLYTKLTYYIDPYSAYETVQVYQEARDDGKEARNGAFDLLTGADVMPLEYESIYPIYIDMQIYFVATVKGKIGIYKMNGEEIIKPKGTYLDNYFYEYQDDGTFKYFVEISNKKGKSSIIEIPAN